MKTLNLRPLEKTIAPFRDQWDWWDLAFTKKSSLTKQEAIDTIEELYKSAIGARNERKFRRASFYQSCAELFVSHFRKVWKSPYTR